MNLKDKLEKLKRHEASARKFNPREADLYLAKIKELETKVPKEAKMPHSEYTESQDIRVIEIKCDCGQKFELRGILQGKAGSIMAYIKNTLDDHAFHQVTIIVEEI